MISVILPVYNGEKYIKKTIRSILNQTVKDLELIIVNDGSIDGTEEIIQSFEDNRILYIKQDNLGVAAAKNTGLKHCNGKFITFHDHDDLSLPNRLERLLDSFYGDIGMVHSDMLLIDDQDNPIGYWKSENINTKDVFSFFINVGTPFNNGTIMYKKEILEDHTFCNYKVGEDTAFIMQIAPKVSSFHIQEPLYFYRRHPDNSTKQIEFEQLTKHILGTLSNSYYKKYMHELDWNNENRKRSELKAKLIIGESLCKRGMMTEGITLFREAIPNIQDEWDRHFYEGMKGLFEKRFHDTVNIFSQLHPKDHIVENFLGEAYLSLQEYENAHKHFLRSLEIMPAYGTPIQNIKALGELKNEHSISQYKRKFL